MVLCAMQLADRALTQELMFNASKPPSLLYMMKYQ